MCTSKYSPSIMMKVSLPKGKKKLSPNVVVVAVVVIDVDLVVGLIVVLVVVVRALVSGVEVAFFQSSVVLLVALFEYVVVIVFLKDVVVVAVVTMLPDGLVAVLRLQVIQAVYPKSDIQPLQ